jgi:hypothetical protein
MSVHRGDAKGKAQRAVGPAIEEPCPLRNLLRMVPRLAGAPLLTMALAGLGFPAAVVAAPPPTRTAAFREATCGLLVDRPLTFSIPRDFVARAGKEGDLLAGCYWGTSSELDASLDAEGHPKFENIHRGIFRNGVSMGVAFNDGKFLDGPGGSLETIKASMRENGIRVSTVREDHAGPFPMLELRGDFKIGSAHAGSSKFFILYIALGIDTNVLYVNYLPPEKASSADDEVWKSVVDGVRAAVASEASAGGSSGRFEPTNIAARPFLSSKRSRAASEIP